MRQSSASFVLFFLTSLPFAAVACGDSNDSAGANNGPGNVSTIAGAEAPDESNGVFVSGNAKSIGQGTRTAPFNSIAAGISAGKASKKSVYACATTYAEQVTLVDGVSVYGNYDCTSWTAIDQHAKLTATASPAVQANTIVSLTTFYGFDVVAPAGTLEQPSSIGLLAIRASSLSIGNSIIQASRGADGVDGVEGVALTLKDGDGKPARAEGDCTGGGSIPVCISNTGIVQPGGVGECIGREGFVPEKGGAGGNSGFFNGACTIGSGGIPNCQWYQICAGAMCAVTPGESFGRGGALPTPGESGKSGTSCTALTLSENGYARCDGTAGTDGALGKGGAGGDGVMPAVPPTAQHEKYFGTAGASGGSGGCPGLAGTAGTGGGASIAAILIDSEATFDHTNLISGAGGKGGKGTFGSAFTKGGKGGAGTGKAEAQDGSAGGASGVSGSGGGGPSLGIATRGLSPRLIESTVTAGQGGRGVDEMQADGKTIPASSSGRSEESYRF